MTLDGRLEQVLRLDAFREVFEELKAADPSNGEGLETALRATLHESADAIQQAVNQPDRLRFALYR